MTSVGYGATDKITKGGDVATGTIVFTGTPPLQIPAGVIAGDVLTSDGAGNAAWAAPTGSSTGALKLTQVPVQTLRSRRPRTRSSPWTPLRGT